LPLTALLRRPLAPLLLACAVAGAAVILNVQLARQLTAIEGDARAIAETWIVRSSTLATFEDGVREFRRQEALAALSTADTAQRAELNQLLAVRARTDRAATELQRLDARTDDSSGTASLRNRWSAYRGLAFQTESVSRGGSSQALQRFRDRETQYRDMLADARRSQEAMRAGANGLALHSQRSTQASRRLVLGRLLVIILFMGLAELARRNWSRRATAEQRWRDVADQSVGVVWELGPTGRVRFCSRSGLDLLGVEQRDLTGRRALRYVHPDDRRNAMQLARNAIPMRAPLRDLEVRIVRPDGGVRWLAVSGQPLLGPDTRYDGFLGLAVDISRRAQAEQALAQGRRMEAVGTLAGGVAHDLNNVLAAVSGYVQLAQAELPPEHVVQADLDSIAQASARGAALVKRILQFARQSPNEQQSVEIAELVHEVARLLRPQLPPHVRVTLELPDTESLVLADPTELHQVIVNIAANALHAMHDTGSTIRFVLNQTTSDVTLTVTDDGIGMDRATLDRAIDPFFTTRDVGEGTGLGLAIAHNVVRALGGTLLIESQLGTGTTVRVTLPRTTASGETAGELRAVEAAEVDAIRVVLVDDDPQVRNSLTRLLTRAGHNVLAFSATAAALDAVRTNREPVDVILTDLSMPLMNGLEFAAQLQLLPSPPPIVMTSGYLDRATSDSARQLGIVALLDKPTESANLLRTLSEAVMQHRRMARDNRR